MVVLFKSVFCVLVCVCWPQMGNISCQLKKIGVANWSPTGFFQIFNNLIISHKIYLANSKTKQKKLGIYLWYIRGRVVVVVFVGLVAQKRLKMVLRFFLLIPASGPWSSTFGDRHRMWSRPSLRRAPWRHPWHHRHGASSSRRPRPWRRDSHTHSCRVRRTCHPRRMMLKKQVFEIVCLNRFNAIGRRLRGKGG